MAEERTNWKVDGFIRRQKQWKAAYDTLRPILLGFPLEEEFKWMHPCYALNGKNVVLMHGFKDYCALLFHKGVLMADPEGILIQQTENVQSARQIRFTSAAQIADMADTIHAYVAEAIRVEESGAEVEMKDTKEFAMPDELRDQFDADPAFKEAFESLTPGRQRGYLLHFSQAKQAKTREARIERNRERIFEGLGLQD